MWREHTFSVQPEALTLARMLHPAHHRQLQNGVWCLPSWPDPIIAQILPQIQAVLFTATPVSLPILCKAAGDRCLPLQLQQSGCTTLQATETARTHTSLHAARYISYMAGSSSHTTTNYSVNPRSAAGPWLPATAPLRSISQCQVRVIHRQTSDLLLCCVSPPPCSCPQSPIKSVWDFLNYPLPANRCGKRMP